MVEFGTEVVDAKWLMQRIGKRSRFKTVGDTESTQGGRTQSRSTDGRGHGVDKVLKDDTRSFSKSAEVRKR